MASTVLALAATDSSGVIKRFEIERRQAEAKDVDIEIKYCGVPGHEIVGIVRSVGAGVTKFKVGDRVGVGCLVDSCRECASCGKGFEQYCPKQCCTYNSKATFYGSSGPKTKILPGHDSEITFGGYSQSIVVDEAYVLRIPDSIDLAAAAPLLCAGITTFSPLAYFGPKELGAEGTTGVVGFGGLGHMAVKIAIAMGNKVVVFSSSPSKKAVVEGLGAKFVCSSNADDMKAMTGSCDFILDTVAANHEIGPYIQALVVGGKLCIVGGAPDGFKFHAFQVTKVGDPAAREQVIGGRKTICGSAIGGVKETQEMLDFCAERKIAANITLIHPKELNHAMASLARNAAQGNRFVIDIAAGLVPGAWEVEADAEIDPKAWTPNGFITPPEARHPAHPK